MIQKKTRIVHWTIQITWNDGEVQYLDDIPNWVANVVDEHLTNYEEYLIEQCE
jgi:hypothetical protein